MELGRHRPSCWRGLGLDITDPDAWDAGFAELEHLIDLAEAEPVPASERST